MNKEDPAVPAEIYFTTWTGALKIGNETISYYSYTNQPEVVARIEDLLKKSLNGRLPDSDGRGKVLQIETSSRARRIFKAVSWSSVILIAGFWFWKQVLLPSEQTRRVLIGQALGAVLLLNLLADMVYHLVLNKWKLSSEHIEIGGWKLREFVPFSKIDSISIEIAREKLRDQRRPGFVLEIKHGQQTSKFNDTKLKNLLPLYDAIIARRPDLKIY